jgi:predicted esterase
MEIQKISVYKTAKVVLHGNPIKAKTAILALHGYGQLAQYFVRKLHSLSEDDFFVVAPEGLHRFYLEGTSGRVGASWMTKEERADDMLDNMNYLDAIYEKYFSEASFDKFVVLGFSQGAATAARWIDHSQKRIDAFIQWAGVFPPDLDLTLNKSAFAQLRHFYVIGNSDPYFYENEQTNTQKKWLQENGLIPEFVEFQGAHTIDSDCLTQILAAL